jgi:YfiH family protein
VTGAPGVACTIMVADCLPVLLAHRGGAVVGAAHAGWRGLAGDPQGNGPGVLEALVQAYVAQDAAHAPQDLLAWLGPCIAPTAFEVGDEVRAAFMAHAGADAALGARLAACFSPAGQPGKFMASLPGLARLRLQAAGVADLHGNDGSAPWCTVGNPERYFSYRRDQQRLGASGRMCAYIWLRD